MIGESRWISNLIKISRDQFSQIMNRKGFESPVKAEPSKAPVQAQPSPQESVSISAGSVEALPSEEFVEKSVEPQEIALQETPAPRANETQNAHQAYQAGPNGTIAQMDPPPGSMPYRGFSNWSMPANPSPHDKELHAMVQETNKYIGGIRQQIAARRSQSAKLHLDTYKGMS